MEGEKRSGETTSLSSFLSDERARLLEGVDEQRAAQFRAAEQRRDVFKAWNDVCAGTREGAHVTGLHYVPERDELVVYLDSAAWAQEMTMLREIVRARMAVKGVNVSSISCRVSKPSYVKNNAAGANKGGKAAAPRESELRTRGSAPVEIREEIESATCGIDDERLRKALEGAMIASYMNTNSQKT